MARKHVMPALTLKEAEAMRHALGNSVDHPDVMEALFTNGHARNAAYRGAQELDNAIAQFKRDNRDNRA